MDDYYTPSYRHLAKLLKLIANFDNVESDIGMTDQRNVQMQYHCNGKSMRTYEIVFNGVKPAILTVRKWHDNGYYHYKNYYFNQDWT